MKPRIELSSALLRDLRRAQHNVFMEYGYYSQEDIIRYLHGSIEFLLQQGFEIKATDRVSEEALKHLKPSL